MKLAAATVYILSSPHCRAAVASLHAFYSNVMQLRTKEGASPSDGDCDADAVFHVLGATGFDMYVDALRQQPQQKISHKATILDSSPHMAKNKDSWEWLLQQQRSRKPLPPHQFLYSVADPQVHYQSVQAAMKQLRSVCGVDVYGFRFEDSPHCQHVLAHNALYTNNVLRFLTGKGCHDEPHLRPPHARETGERR